MWFILRRGLSMIVILFGLSAVLFGLLSLMPGNPVDLLITSNPHIKAEDVMRLKKLRGLDQPWYVQYVRWLVGYKEPARPPLILPIDALQKSGAKRISIDLSEKIIDPNFRPSKEFLKEVLDELWQTWASSSLHEELARAITLTDLHALNELLSSHDPTLAEEFHRFMERKSAHELSVKGLFGAKSEGLSITLDDVSNKDAVYFVVRNGYGQEKVGRVAINNNAKALLMPIGTKRFEDEDKPFKLNLNDYVIDKSAAKKLEFELIESPGVLSRNGIYEHRFKEAGQEAISFIVRDEHGHEQALAFDVEHGVLGRDDAWNGGFLYIFAGDTNALGFSETYKRPVYELLFGPKQICGDGRVDDGESCDVALGQKRGDCDAHCFKKSDSVLSKIDKTLSASIVHSGRISNTLQLMLPALFLSIFIALPLGIFSAYRQYSLWDYILNFGAFLGISLPVFWFGIMMIYLFAEDWAIFPAGGAQTPGMYGEGAGAIILDRLYHACLPIMVLSIFYVGRWLRYVRASMLEVLPQDYVRTARAKGLSEKKVILKHALRNALIPIVTILALSIPSLFGGAVLTETVFSWPGLGRLQYEAVINNDYYVAIVVFLLSAFLVMVGNLCADILYVLVDPRLRKGKGL